MENLIKYPMYPNILSIKLCLKK